MTNQNALKKWEVGFLRNQLTDDSAPSVGKRVFSCQNMERFSTF